MQKVTAVDSLVLGLLIPPPPVILTNAHLRTHAHGPPQPFDANLWILLIATVVTVALCFMLFDYIHLWARERLLKRAQQAGGCSEDDGQALELEKDKFKSARLGCGWATGEGEWVAAAHSLFVGHP